jgi:hypothetical protein
MSRWTLIAEVKRWFLEVSEATQRKEEHKYMWKEFELIQSEMQRKYERWKLKPYTFLK